MKRNISWKFGENPTSWHHFTACDVIFLVKDEVRYHNMMSPRQTFRKYFFTWYRVVVQISSHLDHLNGNYELAVLHPPFIYRAAGAGCGYICMKTIKYLNSIKMHLNCPLLLEKILLRIYSSQLAKNALKCSIHSLIHSLWLYVWWKSAY